MSEISLDINYAALFHHQPFLNALDIRNGNLTIPLPPVAGQVQQAELKRFRAHVYFPPERIEVSQAEGVFCGVRISASGQLIKRESYRPVDERTRPKKPARRLRLAPDARDDSAALSLPGRGAGIAGEIFRRPLPARGRACRSHAARQPRSCATLMKRGIFISRRNGRTTRLRFRSSNGAMHAGRFAGTATWSRANGQANFQARSSIDLKRLLDSFGFGDAARTRSPSARRLRSRLPAPPASGRRKRKSRLSASWRSKISPISRLASRD